MREDGQSGVVNDDAVKSDSSDRDSGDGVSGERVPGELDEADIIARRDADFSRLEDKVALDDLRQRLSAAEAEARDHKDKYLRALAELENVKKRAIKDRADLLKYQGERIFAELLPVIDNLELALQHTLPQHTHGSRGQGDAARGSNGDSSTSASAGSTSPSAGTSAFKSGIELILKLFVDTLAKFEVRSESALGKQFDPARHSALSKVPTADQSPGTVISEFRKAYLYKDKLLRPAEVVVAVELAAESSKVQTDT